MEERDFTSAKLAASGLLLCTGALAVAGVLSLFAGQLPWLVPYLTGACIVAFAGMAGFSLWVAQVAASCIQLLDGDDHYDGARVVAYLCALITGMVSVAGVYLGDAILRGDTPALPPVWAMVLGGFALAFVKQAMFYVITACETKSGIEARSHDELLAVRQREIEALRRELSQARAELEKIKSARPAAPPHATDAPQSGATAAPRRKGAAGGASRTAARAAAKHLAAAAMAAPRFNEAPAIIVTEALLRETVDEMRQAGEVISIRAVARRLKVPDTRVERFPNRREIFEAAKAA